MEAGIDFSELIPSALALALEIDRIHAIADGQTPADYAAESDGQDQEDDEKPKSSC
jgi:hypothetical protein